MSLVEQATTPQGQIEGSEAVAPVEDITEIPMEQPDSHSKPTPKEDPLQVLVDADDEQCFIEEATILNAKELKTKEVMIEPPAIPKRSTLRTSRLLDSLKLNSIETATKSLNTTQNVYLSSEEDASSEADEYSDNEYESSSEEGEESADRRKSQEVTARVVSVIFVGKPCVVELASGRRSVSPVKRPQSELFGRSVSSSSFGTNSLRDRVDYSQRKFSSASSTDLPTQAPSFLSQDPFSSSPYTRRETILTVQTTTSESYPRTPNTPTRAFQRISRTISLATKRSRPSLKAAIDNNPSSSSLNLSNLDILQESPEPMGRTGMDSPAPLQSPVTYNEIIKVARRNSSAASGIASIVAQSSLAVPRSQPASPITPATARRSILSGLNINRRRSMRIRP